ncbi:hypothetical protein R3P38DRAFT_2920597 [Favolaschia claudopus]|uniref:Angiogenic factor with G patch and FHA domains 1 n=1 Tax=Favolaschia claudopus TaxID=2862362 RepID=A0AAW0C1V9_9AGAR
MEATPLRRFRSPSPPPDYHPAYEWPGDSEDPQKKSHAGSLACGLRLVVLRSTVLPVKQNLVIVGDGYTELQFGRDPAVAQDIPRVRLKEMEVSKLHATIYMDGDNYSIVDMGSKHGTFLQPQSSSTAIRLSKPRVASLPRQLHHFDTVAIGNTTFLVHIHPSQSPCDDCWSTSENEIPLFQTIHKRKAAKIPEPDAGYRPPASVDPKKALTMLKQRLLTSSPGPIRSEGTSYADRSARRRSLYPTSRLDAPGVPPPLRARTAVASMPEPPPPSAPWDPPPAVTVSQPPTPLPTTNVGHRLLLAQGWVPGSSLGEDSSDQDEGRIRLTTPLEITATSRRAGIGMPTTASGT